MFKSSLSKTKEWWCHTIFWILWLYFNSIEIHSDKIVLSSFDYFTLSYFLVNFFTFYFNYLYILPKVFENLKWHKVIIGFVSSYLFFVILRYLLEQVISLALFDMSNYHRSTGVLYYLFDNFFFAINPIIFSVGIWIIFYLIRLIEYNHFILEEQKNMEIKFLKAQINPHFIFNTLNNIYSLVYFQSKLSLSAIEKLSNIMRFLTYETQKNHIHLSQEIEYIHSYIALESIRHEESEIVQIEIELDMEGISIPPYLMSPLVENALKHGIIHHKSILIQLYQKKNILYFKVQNEIGNHKKDKLGGFGLENLRNRLSLLYPHQNLLHIDNDGKTFKVTLQIPIHESFN